MNNKINPSYKVIADHLRSSVFLISDGVLPSNEGRGYVLRRIMRRAMRHIHMLGFKNLMMYKIAPTLIEEMGAAYPDLKRAQSLIIDTLKIEEEKFQQTLGRGLEILNEELAKIKNGQKFPGNIAFKLYDTYGFPLDLTQDILKEKNIEVDTEAFDLEMKEQKERAKKNWSGSGEKQDASIYFDLKEKLGATKFLGYEQNKTNSKILAIIADGVVVDSINQQSAANKKVALILDQTPFYATSGGQNGDDGKICQGNSSNILAEISETKKMADSLFVHFASEIFSNIKIGDEITAIINEDNRKARAANHSATHLLHFILKKNLGSQIAQKGSNIDHDAFTFDFNHHQPLSDLELEKIEDEVNFFIRQNSDIKTEVLPIKQAQEKGAVALFGEKYDDVVRVLSMAKDPENKDLSVEFCGGTHAKRTGDIGLFKIISEKGIAAGVRRITATTGFFAISYLREEEKKMQQKIVALEEQSKSKEKEIEKLRKEKLSSNSANLTCEKIGSINFIHHLFDGVNAKDLRELINQSKSKKEFEANSVILFFGYAEDKIAVCLSVSQDLLSKFDASKLIGKVVEEIGGKGGGGKPDLSFGGGVDKNKIATATKLIRDIL